MQNRYVRAAIGGGLAGLVGALLWAFISAYIGAEIAFVAWGVGGAVGVGVHVAVGGTDLNDNTGYIAVAFAMLAVFGGKYLAVDWALDNELEKFGVNDLPTEQDAKLTRAYETAFDRERSGEELAWPANSSLDRAEAPADFPPDLWKDIEAEWAGMSEEDRGALRESIRVERQQRAAAFVGEIRQSAFADSFGPYDLLWMILALGTAYRVGAQEEVF